MQGIRKAAESLAASTDKATGGFNSRKQDPSMPSDKAVQVTDLLKSVRTVFREIAAGPEPAPEPQKSEKTGETLAHSFGAGRYVCTTSCVVNICNSEMSLGS